MQTDNKAFQAAKKMARFLEDRISNKKYRFFFLTLFSACLISFFSMNATQTGGERVITSRDEHRD